MPTYPSLTQVLNRVFQSQAVTYLAQAARTTTPTTSDAINYGSNGMIVVINTTSPVGAPSIVVTIEGKDTISNQYYTILASAAITTATTTVLRVHPDMAAAANTTAQFPLPSRFRITVTHANTDSITYSLGYYLVP